MLGEQVSLDDIGDLSGLFSWDFGCSFFIETDVGNFVWNDPSYNGSGEIRRYNGKYKDFLKEYKMSYLRDKGRHIIKDYILQSC